MTKTLFFLFAVVTLSSCVTSKKYKKLDADYMSVNKMYEKSQTDFSAAQKDIQRIKEELDYCKKMNEKLTGSVGEMALLSRKEAENLQKSLQKIQEKDLQITYLHQALTRKDSVTIALATSLKSAVGIYDKDIEISVEKGVVFVSISDKFLFKTGSYQ